MDEKLKVRLMMVFTAAYLTAFTIVALLEKNYEFLYYTAIVSFLIGLVLFYNLQFRLGIPITFGLTVLAALHIFGGNVYVGPVRLYEFWFIEGLLRYDNVVHLLGTFIVTFIVYNLLAPHISLRFQKKTPVFLSLMLVFIALGIGALNEVLELIAVLFLDAGQQVGDYFNNAFDLVFNMIGAVLAVFFIGPYYKLTRKRVDKAISSWKDIFRAS